MAKFFDNLAEATTDLKELVRQCVLRLNSIADPQQFVYAALKNVFNTLPAMNFSDSTYNVTIPTSNTSVVEVTSTTVTLTQNTIYIMNNASLITATLPSTIAQGSFFTIIGKGAGGWKVAQLAGQTIRLTSASTTTGTGGSLSSGSRYDNAQLRCITANTELSATARNGNLVVV